MADLRGTGKRGLAPLARAAAGVKRRLGMGRSPFRRLVEDLALPRDARVLVLGGEAEHVRELRRRFGHVVIDEPRAGFDLLVVDVPPERVPDTVERILPTVMPSPGGVAVIRLVTDLVAAYRGPLPPDGAEPMAAFLKRRFGRLRLDEPAVHAGFGGSARLVAETSFLGWAIVRTPPAPAGPKHEPPPARGRLPQFADEVRALAAEGRITGLDLVGPCEGCDAELRKWGEWARTAFRGTVPLAGLPRPPLDAAAGTEILVPGVALALLVIPGSLEEYLQAIGPKSRNMLRKLEREGYTTGPLDYNAHLDDLHAINTSKPVRSGGPMTEAYMQPLKPIGTAPDRCPRHRSVYVGAFRDGRALGYSRLVLVNELAVIDQILGHADALPHGVMNGLVRELVRVALDSDCVRAINYLTLRSSTPTLDRFKRSVGFEARAAYLRVPAT